MQKSHYKISFVLTTYNKLPHLKHALTRLFTARQQDEEIIICDGGSTDGSSEFIQNLYETGKVQQYISEPDKGEAHALNKGMLMAKGEIIKCISDDDAFNYPIIRKAAEFMIENPEIDIVTGYNAALLIEDISFARIKEDPARDFRRWLQTKEPFQMIGLPLLIRRASLPHTGLLAIGVIMVDLEFTYRISSLNVNIAWCSGVLSMHISHPGGNFNRMSKKAKEMEYSRIVNFYTTKKRESISTIINNGIESIKRPIRPAKRAFFDKMGWKQYQNPESFDTNYKQREGEDTLSAAYRVCDEFFATQNNRHVVFIK